MAKINTYFDYIGQIYHDKLPWDKLTGCNIMVTGSTGLIGGCLVDALMLNPKRNYHVFASGRNNDIIRHRFSRYIDDDSFHSLIYDVTRPLECSIQFDYIIHAASNASPNIFAQKPVEVIMANIYGVDNLLRYGINHGMKRFLFISTGEIYGQGDGRAFTEDYSGYVDTMSPRSCYPSGKRAAETLCVSYAKEYGADIVVARPCHVYGPYFTDKDNRVYAQFIRNVIQGEDIVMKSDGKQFRSWCFVVDCVAALLYILLKGENGEAYNIADANSNISIRDLAETIAEIGHKAVVIDVPGDDEKCGYNAVTKSLFSTEKLEALGWDIKGSMKDKLKSTINELL